MSALPSDDRDPIITSLDRVLLSQLETAASQQFFAGCDRITQTLLSRCQWSLMVNQDIPALSIACPDSETYWSIVGSVENIGNYLRLVTSTSRIEVIPGDKKNLYFEIEIGD